ncbi:5-methyltetrahydropteroyltriglutamate--homocysteine S-methyltransferase [Shouchella patagoniensis]|uniref:5-methyltetrahydropteroyltriglutamate-- homocysteine S-methyltransferase n=1 Tax=Shouchella patagoniensis TaxID=228576 RepID=UPI000994FF21|nr:5-methyltetrahydropteroyltriglutamate--homocysteine S-methyltransferase [Shouchella patagoniensis]
MSKTKSSSLGYPRIGKEREWKRSLESFWSGKTTIDHFQKEQKQLRLSYLNTQKTLGIDYIPVGDFSYYDHVLDTAVAFGLVPSRFEYEGGQVSDETYFAIARGTDSAVAAEMTKWYNTNYHYIVPELNAREPKLVDNRWLRLYEEAKSELGIDGKPVLLGPISFVQLAKQYGEKDFSQHVASLVPLYVEVFNQLAEAGATLIQVDEPGLAGDVSEEVWTVLERVYQTFAQAAPKANVLLQTYFESVSDYDRLIKLPVSGFGLDFVHGKEDVVNNIKKQGFPAGKILAAGIIDGRNIWRKDLTKAYADLETITEFVEADRLIVQPSCSLLHVPVSVEVESTLPKVLKEAIAFANEKLTEVVTLANVKNSEIDANILIESKQAIERLDQSESRNNKAVQKELAVSKTEDTSRGIDAQTRYEKQTKKLQLPLLPTTTIGSFPQTKEVRKKRLDWRKERISNSEYEEFIQDEMDRWIAIQEDIGLDVLVHGEFERTDMVEFFGEKLGGFQFTANGWVQSYGSRCVKPPVIYGDVHFKEAMTVKETVYAQSKTTKPVKGMLTGPVTIYNWSFPRTDVSEADVVNQIALALKKEVLALEENGIGVIQVDEPALREGLPLKRAKWDAYLNQSVIGFQLTVNHVQPETQIHTHMCYSDFQDIIEAIDALDADVISIEMSRSHGELISSFEDFTYDKGIGLGVYDIHSPRVPAQEEMERNIERALQVLDQRLFWVNPDCGLKTRQEPETVEALKVMVQAANKVRQQIEVNK